MNFRLIFRAYSFCLLLLALCGNVASQTQTGAAQAWNVLEAGTAENNASEREIALRALGLVPENTQAVRLAEKSLTDRNPHVRTAGAAALGQMHAVSAAPQLKKALSDKDLSVVLAAAHALYLMNDPSCYEIYYGILTGQRKGEGNFAQQELKTLQDPKQVEQMAFNEGIGFVPFVGTGWGALQTILKDRKDEAVAKAALVTALATDPDSRAGDVLVAQSKDKELVVRVAALEAIARRGDPKLLPQFRTVSPIRNTKCATRLRRQSSVSALSPLRVARCSNQLLRRSMGYDDSRDSFHPHIAPKIRRLLVRESWP